MDLSIPGATIREDVIVPAREPWSIKMRAREILRIIDLEGQQAVDFLCYSADDPSDRYNAANTIKLNGNIYLGPRIRARRGRLSQPVERRACRRGAGVAWLGCAGGDE